MDNINFLKIANSKIDLVVSERNTSNLTQPELATEAILALMNCLDCKQFEAAGVRDNFDTCLNRIAESVYSVGKWGGWQDIHP